MKYLNWQTLLGIALILLSCIVYFVHYLIFRDAHHILIYFIGDVGFVFVEVLLVTLIIHRVFQEREKKERLEKLNMVIGAFCSEVGIKLLKMMSQWDPQAEKIQKNILIKPECFNKDFTQSCMNLKKYNYEIEKDSVDWSELRDFLVPKRNFLLRLLENQNILEHEYFTDLLWAVYHLTEELEAREDITSLPDTDHEHLLGDVKRVYGQLTLQWFKYMKHLNSSYPYLFSLSLRKNPFDRNASPIVQGS